MSNTIAGMTMQEVIADMCDGDARARHVAMGHSVLEECTPVRTVLERYIDDMKQELHHAARLLWLTAD